MKILDHMRAKRISKEQGAEYTEKLNLWNENAHKLQEALASGIHEDVKVSTYDMMPEGLFFYDLSGSIIIEGQGISTVNATVVDNSYNTSISFRPAYMLIKNNPNSKEEPSINNTTLYKVSYTETTLRNPEKHPYFTVETLVENTNPATKEYFPYIFQTSTIPDKFGSLGRAEHSHYPEVKYDAAETSQLSGASRAIKVYKESIMKPIRAYSKRPQNTIDMGM